MRQLLLLPISVVFLLSGCSQKIEYKEILAFPVYGQSLALAEEAERISDNKELQSYGGRILTQNLDTDFGYFADTWLKQRIKRLIGYKKRYFELSSYGMAEYMIDNDMIEKGQALCICPGGRGATAINGLVKGTQPYNKFMSEIKTAYDRASKRGVVFRVPAVCYMPGETDITDGSGAAYKTTLSKLRQDMSNDIRKITGQREEVKFICDQVNCITLSKNYDSTSFLLRALEVPQAQLDLVVNDTNFIPSGPLYPYSYVDQYVHMDGLSQKRFGALSALSAQRLLHGEPRKSFLYPDSYSVDNDTIVQVFFNVPFPPLSIDTLSVRKVKNYGFSVVNESGSDILDKVQLTPESVLLYCNGSVHGTSVRYAVNGQTMKSGNVLGSRGNLRDSQGDKYNIKIKGKIYTLPNWCYQFALLVK